MLPAALHPFGTVQDFYAAVSSESTLTVTNMIAALVIILVGLFMSVYAMVTLQDTSPQPKYIIQIASCWTAVSSV